MQFQCSLFLTIVLTLLLPQNGKFLVDHVDENLSDLKIPKDLLLKASLMSCDYAPVEKQLKDCTAPGGMATDFNIWDRAMKDKELIDWTTCG